MSAGGERHSGDCRHGQLNDGRCKDCENAGVPELIKKIAEMKSALSDVVEAWLHEANLGDGIMEEHAPILARARAALGIRDR